MVCLGDPLDEHVVVDPFHHGVVADAPAEPVLHPVDLLLRVLTNIRALAARQGRSLDAARTQLWATELSLLLPRHPLDAAQGARRAAGPARRLRSAAHGSWRTTRRCCRPEEAEPVLQHARLARARLN